MEGPPLGPGGEDITLPDQVAPRGRKASSTRKIKPQTSNLKSVGRLRLVPHQVDPLVLGTFHLFCREMEEHFSVFLHPNGVSAWALHEEAQKLF